MKRIINDEYFQRRVLCAFVFFLAFFFLNSFGATWADGKEYTLGKIMDWLSRFIPASCGAMVLFSKLEDASPFKSLMMAIGLDVLILASMFITVLLLYIVLEILNVFGLGGLVVGILAFMGMYYTPVLIIIVL